MAVYSAFPRWKPAKTGISVHMESKDEIWVLEDGRADKNGFDGLEGSIDGLGTV